MEQSRPAEDSRPVEAVLCDRDGTLVADVPYNGDPARVVALPGVLTGLGRLRAAGLRVAVVSNQSGVARGMVTPAQVAAVNARVDELLGPFEHFLWCPHGPDDGCDCRKPAPGMIRSAADRLGIPPERCVVIGDIGADVEAAAAAGAGSVMVPTAVTRPEEVAAAPCVVGDFAAAVDVILAGAAPGAGPPEPPRTAHDPGGRTVRGVSAVATGGVLVARLDNLGDVLLAGPAVRAAAATGRPVHLLCGPRGRAAGDLLPGPTAVSTFHAPWIEPDPMAVSEGAAGDLVTRVRAAGITTAAILASSHQSPLPLALLLRWAGVEQIAAVSHEHAGSLLDIRIPGDPAVHEVRRGLLVTEALGFPTPADDRLAVDLREGGLPADIARGLGAGHPGFVVMHPGASVPARTLAPAQWAGAVAAVRSAGRTVVLTGTAEEARIGEPLLGEQPGVMDLRGRLTVPELGTLLARADAVVCGNTGPMHLAAAVGTPVVAAFAPTVPLERWRPWRVPHVVVGAQDVPCAGCRSRVCPLDEQVCLSGVDGAEVVAALDRLAPAARTEAVTP